MDDADLADLRRAKLLLESPGLAMKLACLIGRPVEWGLARLPRPALDAVVGVSRKALEKALDAALRTMEDRRAAPSDWLHRVGVAATGAVGGAAGLAGLPFELPVSTVLMLRSVADHARAQGEDLARPETRVGCLMVFALGGTKPSDDAAEVGYFAVRAALARAVTEAAEYVAERMAAEAAADRAAPVLARLVARIATRFAPQVADKVAAQALPVVGAVGGAAVNLVFINHFQDMAAGHFTVRRLERRHGVEVVRAAYEFIGAS